MSETPAQDATPAAPVKRPRGRPVGTVQEVSLDAVIPPIRCRSQDLARWQAQAEEDGTPFAEHVRSALNAYSGD